MEIVPARTADEAKIKELLANCELPTSDLYLVSLEFFLTIWEATSLVGVVGLQAFGKTGLLRSLAVHPDQRGHGYGTQLTAQIEQRARDSGVKTLYLLTTTAENFFAAQGYARAERGSAPPEIQATAEFRDLCPYSAILMIKTLA